MPIQVVFEPENNLMFATFSGDVSPEDILQNSLWEHQQPDFRAGMHSLVDLSAVQLVGVSFNTVFHYSKKLPEIAKVRGPCRWALVSHELLTYGLLRMFSLINQESPIQIRAFRSLDEGRRWLQEQD